MYYKVALINMRDLVKEVKKGKLDKATAAAMIKRYVDAVVDPDEKTKVEMDAALATTKLAQI